MEGSSHGGGGERVAPCQTTTNSTFVAAVTWPTSSIISLMLTYLVLEQVLLFNGESFPPCVGNMYSIGFYRQLERRESLSCSVLVAGCCSYRHWLGVPQPTRIWPSLGIDILPHACLFRKFLWMYSNRPQQWPLTEGEMEAWSGVSKYRQMTACSVE